MNLKMFKSFLQQFKDSLFYRTIFLYKTPFWHWMRYMFYSTAQTEVEIADDFWFELNRGHIEMDLNDDLLFALGDEFSEEFVNAASDEDLLSYWKTYTQHMLNHYKSTEI